VLFNPRVTAAARSADDPCVNDFWTTLPRGGALKAFVA
jgi:hypothetical protein